MLNNNEKENENNKKVKIRDSSHNKSRITMEYEYNPINDLLGKGGFGEVYKVKLINNINQQKFYAVKIVDKHILYNNFGRASRLLNEIKIHRSLNHENICKYEHCFEDYKKVYILMEYCEKGNLSSLLKTRLRLEEIEIRFYMFQVLLVLKYLRRQKIVHRDLTLRNIFLKDYKTVKIGDFGFAFKENEYEENNGEICGTPGYYTPESNNYKYSYKTDIFDFGVCIYYLFGGKLPLDTSQLSYDLFVNEDIEFEKKVKLSEEAFDLLKKTITLENKRIDLDTIYVHPFFKKGKGLSKESFPDYDDKDYMIKIAKLTNDFDIKPMTRTTIKEVKQILKKKKKRKKKTLSSNISYFFDEKSDDYSSSSGDSRIISSNKNSYESHPKNVTFTLSNKNGKNSFDKNTEDKLENSEKEEINLINKIKKSKGENKIIFNNLLSF